VKDNGGPRNVTEKDLCRIIKVRSNRHNRRHQCHSSD